MRSGRPAEAVERESPRRAPGRATRYAVPMLALHATWTEDDRLALWAEDPDRRRSARPRRGASPRLHPFAAEVHAIAAVVRTIRPSVAADATAVDLSLPSARSAPVPSPQLWIEEPSPDPTGTQTWRVPALAVATRDAADLLLVAGAATGHGAVLGDSVRWLGQVTRFALELCARGRLVPTLSQGPDGWRAWFRPWLGLPEDLARRATLARGAPCALKVDRILDALVRTLAVAGVTPAGTRARTAEQGWLAGLAGAPISTDLPGLAALAGRVAAWSSAREVPTDGFRTCFRIAAPEDDAGPWRLDFLLQAVDDPSLLVPASEVWRTSGRVLRAGAREVADPQEKLLGDLGRAVRLAPIVRASLTSARPSGLELDAERAWLFLREQAPVLAQSGFGVLAPPWWGRPGARLGARARAVPVEAPIGTGAFGLDALVDVSWEIVLGDEALPREELERLARLKAPLVRVRGQWVELRPEDVDQALAFYRKRDDARLTVRDVLRVGLGLGGPARGGLPPVGLVATGWLGDLLDDAREAAFAPVSAPPGFRATLRPYQERGLGWLSFLDRLGLGACLADDMGLGKTVQLLGLLALERAGGARPLPTLLVCPMSLVGNWEREALRFAPDLRVVVHHGADRAAGATLARAVEDADLVLTTYGLVVRDEQVLRGIRWGRVVLDEAQNVKNAATRQATAVRAIAAPRRVALTGTPVENRLSELWSILDFLNPGLLGTAHAFRRTFAVPIERHGDEAAAQRLKHLTGPFVLRRSKTDRSVVPDLPDKLEIRVACNLTREQATLYKAVVDEMLDRVAGLDGQARRGAVLAAMTKLKQVCDHPALLLQDRSALPARSGKLDRLEEILDEVVANGEKALVFTQFTEMGHPLKDHLQARLGREVLFLHGGTGRAARDAMVARFAEAAGPPVFLLSLKAGGTGLNLVAASHVVHFDRWWNPAVEDQATDRAFRIGQQRDVQVRKLVCAGTLEERIDAMIEAKRELAGKVVGAGEGWLADLSTKALRELVALDERAVGEA